MAGDWIKVERALIRKPEVLETAELLGIARREAVGLFVEYFIWLDEHLCESRNGLVTHVSRKSVEEALQCQGFAAILERIGWASFDDEAWTMVVINAQRHNGNTAKTRALGQKRASRFRNDSVTPKALPEKRREENIKAIEALPKLSTEKRLQEPTPEHQTLAATLGVDCQAEFLKYRDWLSAAGKRHRNEGAGFRNWLRKAAEWAPAKPVLHKTAAHMPAKFAPHEELTPMPENVKALLDAFVQSKRVA